MYSSLEVDIGRTLSRLRPHHRLAYTLEIGKVAEGRRQTETRRSAGQTISRNDFGRMDVLLVERNAPASTRDLPPTVEQDSLARGALRWALTVLRPSPPVVDLHRTRVRPTQYIVRFCSELPRESIGEPRLLLAHSTLSTGPALRNPHPFLQNLDRIPDSLPVSV